MKSKKTKYHNDDLNKKSEDRIIKETAQSHDDKKRLEKWQIGRKKFP